MFKRNSILIKEVILKNLREQGLETPLLQKRLIDAWPVVMGETIASYTTSLNIRNQTLFVHLTNPALRMELSMQRQDIVRRLNEHVGNQVIADREIQLIRIVHKRDLSAIFFRPHREMQPVATTLIAFNEQFVIILLSLIRIVHQNHRIPHRLLNAIHSDIHGAPCQMIACR